MKNIYYRLVSVIYLQSGGIVIDSDTFESFESKGDAIQSITKRLEVLAKDPNIKSKWIFNEDCTKYILLQNNKPYIDYELYPMYIYDDYYVYRDMKIVCNNDNYEYTIFYCGYNMETPITRKNTMNECVMFIDQFSVIGNPYIVDETRRKNTCKNYYEQITNSEKGTLPPVS